MAARCFCLTSIVIFPVPSLSKIRKISLGCDAFFQFWNMNGKSHEQVITELERAQTSATWLVALFIGDSISDLTKGDLNDCDQPDAPLDDSYPFRCWNRIR
jgi:hypothetical protein